MFLLKSCGAFGECVARPVKHCLHFGSALHFPFPVAHSPHDCFRSHCVQVILAAQGDCLLIYQQQQQRHLPKRREPTSLFFRDGLIDFAAKSVQVFPEN